MCGRYYRKSDKQKIAEHFHVHNDIVSIVLPDADYNVAPLRRTDRTPASTA
jgi:hypothetical protein